MISNKPDQPTVQNSTCKLSVEQAPALSKPYNTAQKSWDTLIFTFSYSSQMQAKTSWIN